MGVEIIATECSYKGGKFIFAGCDRGLVLRVLRWEEPARYTDLPRRTELGGIPGAALSGAEGPSRPVP